MKQLSIIVFITFFCLSFSKVESPKSAVVLKVEGIEKIEGNIEVLVFSKEDGFPEAADKAIMKAQISVTKANMEISLGALPYGQYAIALIQDKNSNHIFDKNILGIPTEPFGFSNVDRVYFGPPSFAKASFQLNRATKSITVKLLEI